MANNQSGNVPTWAYILVGLVGAAAIVAAALIGRESDEPKLAQATPTVREPTTSQRPTNPPRREPTIDVHAIVRAAISATHTAIAKSAPTATPTPSATATPTATATPRPTNTPVPRPGTVLYKADWSNGLNGWSGSGGWKTVGGMLVFGGDDSFPSRITAPYQPGDEGIDDYAVEADIQWLGKGDGFGVAARSSEEGAYWAGFQWCVEKYAYIVPAPDEKECRVVGGFSSPFTAYDPGQGWNNYRLEVKGNRITLFINGTRLLKLVDNQHLYGGQVGVWSYSTQIDVRNFKVIKL